MAKSVKAKNNFKENGENILYLSENDANALGIFEDSIQRVYVDDHEVEVVFVDEHEIIPATSEERKVYRDAEQLAQKYLSSNTGSDGEYREDYGFTTKRTHWWDKFKIGKKQANNHAQVSATEYENYDSSYDEQRSYNEASRALKPVSRRSNTNFSTENTNERARRREEILVERENLRNENQRLDQNRRDSNRTNKFAVKSDVFTEEELEVLQGIMNKNRVNNDTRNTTRKTTNNRNQNSIKTIKTTTNSKSHQSNSKVKTVKNKKNINRK